MKLKLKQKDDEGKQTESTKVAAEPTEEQQQKFEIGMKVRKYFYGDGWFIGTIQSYNNGRGDDDDSEIENSNKYYRIVYEDGDMEDLNETEVENIIITESFATKIPKITLTGKKRGNTKTNKNNSTKSHTKRVSKSHKIF